MVDKRMTVNDSEDDEQMFVDEDEETSEVNVKTKKKKAGIIFLSTIPKNMSPAHLRDILSQYGDIGRVYLQENIKDIPKKGKKRNKKIYARDYTEGWVEFKSKRVAKEVARILNNTHVGERKKNKFYDYIWTMKYLPRFKWTHLSERLAYEQAVRKQRMRIEISQAKREADHFSLNVDKSEKLKKKKSKGQKMMDYDISQIEIPQRETEDLIIEKKHVKKRKQERIGKNKGGNVDESDSLLKTLFS